MSCKKVRKWLSDRIDGELSPKKERVLQAHLETCASCRDYSARLDRLQAEAHSLGRPQLSPQYWRDFSSRLEGRISSSVQEERRPEFRFLRWRWSYAGAGLAVLCGLVALLVFFQPQRTGQVYPLSQEETLAEIDQTVSGNPGLVSLFNQVVLDSIDEAVQGMREDGPLEFIEDPLFLDSLTEEEIEVWEVEIIKEMKS